MPRPPAGKSRSRTRNKPRDWAQLNADADAFSREIMAQTGIDFDENYVDALERAIEGRDPKLLLQLLDDGRLVPPACLPILADAIRSLRDDSRGAGRKLTSADHAAIRIIFDDESARARAVYSTDRQARLVVADMWGVSDDTIKESLDRTSGK